MLKPNVANVAHIASTLLGASLILPVDINIVPIAG
jgi:hypothetical protein